MNRRKTKVDILKIEGCHKVTSYHFLKKTKKKTDAEMPQWFQTVLLPLLFNQNQQQYKFSF